MNNICVNDLIIAVGKTTTSEGIIENHHVLATVVEVGKFDVFVREDNRSKAFKIPKKSCIKINASSVNTHSDISEPLPGDLVLSFSESYTGKTEKKVGVLMEIIDIPGKYKMSKILCGDTLESVCYDTLIVLE